VALDEAGGVLTVDASTGKRLWSSAAAPTAAPAASGR
jgi:hypothetical protein